LSGAVVVYGLLGESSASGISQPAISGIANAASYASDAVSPGEMVTIFGANFGPSSLTGLELDSTGSVATSLSGTSVLFDGNLAPIVYASANQVSAVVPYSLSNSTTQVEVRYQGSASALFTMNVTAAAPGIFTSDGSGSGQATALNQDGSINSSDNPASTGSVLVFYATGGGQTSPNGVDGSITSSDSLPQLVQPVAVTIGGQPAQVLYAGDAPGSVAGLLQINAQIPAGIAPGSSVPITLQVGGQTSPQSVTIAVE